MMIPKITKRETESQDDYLTIDKEKHKVHEAVALLSVSPLY